MKRSDELKLIVVEELQCALGQFVNRKINDVVLEAMASAANDVFCRLKEEGWFTEIPTVVMEQSVNDPNMVCINCFDDGQVKPLREWFWRNM